MSATVRMQHGCDSRLPYFFWHLEPPSASARKSRMPPIPADKMTDAQKKVGG